MNKYQLYFLRKIIKGVDHEQTPGGFDVDDNGQLTVIQNEDYHIVQYDLLINNKDISSISYFERDWKDADANSEIILIPFNFDRPVTRLKIKMKNGMVDDFEVPVGIKKASKEPWDRKCEEKIKAERLSNIKCILSKSENLSTLCFKPCCNEYSYSIVKWYATKTIYGAKRPEYVDYLLEEQKIENAYYSNIEVCFETWAEISQFDKNGNLLIFTKAKD